METAERIRILELAFQVVEPEAPHRRSGGITEASIKQWHKLFDQTYKAILNTALGKEPT